MFKVSVSLCLSGIIFSLNSFAQNFSPVFTETNTSSALGGSFDYAVNSSSVNIKFINTFYRGDFIDQDLKQSVFDKTKDKNRLSTPPIGKPLPIPFAVVIISALIPLCWCAKNLPVRPYPD